MEYRYVIHYVVDGQPETLNLVTESPELSPAEAQRRVEEKTRPYAPKTIGKIIIAKQEQSDNINTDPETSASE